MSLDDLSSYAESRTQDGKPIYALEKSDVNKATEGFAGIKEQSVNIRGITLTNFVMEKIL